VGLRLRDSVRAAIATGGAAVGVGLALQLQEVALARTFGAGPAADAFQVAAQIPQLLLHVLAGGALQGALLPPLVRARAQGGQAVDRLLATALRHLAAILAPAALGVALLLPPASTWISPAAASATLTQSLVWLTAPVLLSAGLASLYAVVLISHHRFAMAVAPQALPPLTLTLATLGLAPHYGIPASAAGLLLGSLLQLGLCYAATRRLGIATPPGAASDGQRLRELWGQYWPAALSIALMSAMLAAGLLQAYGLGAGSAAAFGYASRPVLLVGAFVTVTVGNSLLPFLTREVHSGNRRGLYRLLATWTALILAGSLAATGLWWALADQIVGILYQGGAFGQQVAAQVSGTQRVLLLLLPWSLLGMLLTRMGNALGWNGRMLPAAALALATELLSAPHLASHWGLTGVATSLVLGYGVWALTLTVILMSRPWTLGEAPHAV
jgi:putative peptidoglycan lipid II flippase